MKKFNRGFTIIELLVVIAIIGVLSSIVLASLSSARGKAANNSIKANLSNARAQGELYQDTNGANGYLGVCGALNSSGGVESIKKFIDAAHAVSGATSITYTQNVAQSGTTMSACHASASGWAASVPLKVPEINGAITYLYYCVDSTGASLNRVSVLGTNAVICPAS